MKTITKFWPVDNAKGDVVRWQPTVEWLPGFCIKWHFYNVLFSLFSFYRLVLHGLCFKSFLIKKQFRAWFTKILFLFGVLNVFRVELCKPVWWMRVFSMGNLERLRHFAYCSRCRGFAVFLAVYTCYWWWHCECTSNAITSAHLEMSNKPSVMTI